MDLFSLENIYNAYITCRKNKRNTVNALAFEARLLDNLCCLRDELVSRTYYPSSSICFLHKKPKLREIFAADFRDRVVHHLLVGYLEPIFEPVFIHDSYACRVGKGVHKGVKRLKRFLGKVTANGTQYAWYLKEDISGFFMNIDKSVLYRMLSRKIKRKDVLWLAETIIFHDCTKDYRFKGDMHLLERVPDHKTLFKVGKNKGLPIGNLTSQFFANVYLNALDQFVKHKLKCNYYIRYCDDFVLLANSPELLSEWKKLIESFINQTLLLDLNHKQHKLSSVSSGIDFLGYIVRRKYVLVRRRVVNNFKERLDAYDKKLGSPQKGLTTVWQYDPVLMEGLRSVIASYMGHFRWANTYRLSEKIFENHSVFRAGFLLDYRTLKIIPRYLSIRKNSGFRFDYKWWAGYFHICRGYIYPLWVNNDTSPKVLIFFQVGNFYEFYDNQALSVHKIFGLTLRPGMRGFKYGCGLHMRWTGCFVHRAVNLGYHVALVKSETLADGKKNRRLVCLIRGKKKKEVFLHTKRKKHIQLELPLT